MNLSEIGDNELVAVNIICFRFAKCGRNKYADNNSKYAVGVCVMWRIVLATIHLINKLFPKQMCTFIAHTIHLFLNRPTLNALIDAFIGQLCMKVQCRGHVCIEYTKCKWHNNENRMPSSYSYLYVFHFRFSVNTLAPYEKQKELKTQIKPSNWLRFCSLAANRMTAAIQIRFYTGTLFIIYILHWAGFAIRAHELISYRPLWHFFNGKLARDCEYFMLSSSSGVSNQIRAHVILVESKLAQLRS